MEDYKKIKGFESACKALKRKAVLPDVSMLPEKHQQYFISNIIIVTVIEAINLMPDGKIWEPDYNDSNQRKYEPRFWIKASKSKPGGFGFSGTNYVYWFADTNVGSRLCFPSFEKMQHAIKILKKHYLQQILIIKPSKTLITK